MRKFRFPVALVMILGLWMIPFASSLAAPQQGQQGQKKGLTPEQKAQLVKLRLQHLQKIAPLKAKLYMLQVEWTVLVTQEGSKPEQLTAKVQQMAQVKSQLWQAKAEFHRQHLGLLPDKKATWVRMMMIRKSLRGKHHKRRHKMKMMRKKGMMGMMRRRGMGMGMMRKKGMMCPMCRKMMMMHKKGMMGKKGMMCPMCRKMMMMMKKKGMMGKQGMMQKKGMMGQQGAKEKAAPRTQPDEHSKHHPPRK